MRNLSIFLIEKVDYLKFKKDLILILKNQSHKMSVYIKLNSLELVIDLNYYSPGHMMV